MTITEQEWSRYIQTLRKLSDAVADKVKTYVDRHGVDNTKELIDYSYALVTEYGEGAAALSAQMYDILAELEGRYLEPAEPAPTASYGEVAKAVNGTLKTSVNSGEISGAVSRWVKMAGSDTTIKNSIRDGAEFAWIPRGDTCPFCLTLASRGWQKASKKALKNGHAEHIHANCDCQYAVRFDSKSKVAGYDPDKYKKMYYEAEGNTPSEKINALRRMQYEENKDMINARKRAAYAKANGDSVRDRFGFFSNNNKSNPHYYDATGKDMATVEKEISKLDYEVGVIFDKNGHVISVQLGNEDTVSFTNYQVRKMKGADVTHNHPTGVRPSPEDLYLYLDSGANSFRTTGRKGTYVLESSMDFSKLPDFKEFSREYNNIVDNIRDKYITTSNDINDLYDALAKLDTDLWERLYKKYGVMPRLEER